MQPTRKESGPPSRTNFFTRLLFWLLAIVGAAAMVLGLLFALYLYKASDILVAVDEPVPCRDMVVLAGDPTRPLYAAEIYGRGLAENVWIARPWPDPKLEIYRSVGLDALPEEEVNRLILEKNGVPPEAIHEYGNGVLSTVEEAEALRDMLGPAPACLLVVTSPYHTRRAGAVYRKVFPDTDVRLLGVEDDPLPGHWWRRRSGAERVLLETAKFFHWLLGRAYRSSDLYCPIKDGPRPRPEESE